MKVNERQAEARGLDEATWKNLKSLGLWRETQ